MQQGLYDPRFEHDACGVGFIARVSAAGSHELLEMGLEALARLAHRGAVAADGRSGDGAGITAAVPRRLLQRFLEEAGYVLDPSLPLAAGMTFLDSEETRLASEVLGAALAQEGLQLLCWRDVPVDTEALGHTAFVSMPVIRQALVIPQSTLGLAEFEVRLHRAR